MYMTPETRVEHDKCVAAFEAQKTCDLVWCCHHELLFEELTEYYAYRIRHILNHKPAHEQTIRLKNFRPCSEPNVVRIHHADFEKELVLLQKGYSEAEAKFDESLRDQVRPYKQELEEGAKLLVGHPASLLILTEGLNAKIDAVWQAGLPAGRILAQEWQTKEVALAQKYMDKLLPLYWKDVPEGTWNGKSIFNFS